CVRARGVYLPYFDYW
nr:immunoglobulin heavy chain junction region [Macaca mulatta]MOW82720.1 immunoglobulin heavy chain junction region [Macaca mulatta]